MLDHNQSEKKLLHSVYIKLDTSEDRISLKFAESTRGTRYEIFRNIALFRFLVLNSKSVVIIILENKILKMFKIILVIALSISCCWCGKFRKQFYISVFFFYSCPLPTKNQINHLFVRSS